MKEKVLFTFYMGIFKVNFYVRVSKVPYLYKYIGDFAND